MREPDIDTDGWCLDDGEAYHRAAPKTFWIPDLAERRNLRPGDLAKLIFQIHIDDDDDPIRVERMWVIVRERIDGGYLGLLDNDPTCLDENDILWSGIELPFQPRHIIDVDERNDNTLAALVETPRRLWPR